MELKYIIGHNIRAHRKRLKLTQKQLAKLIYANNISVCRWELGDTTPSAEFIVRMARVFGCATDDICKEN